MITPEERTELVDEAKKEFAQDLAKALGVTVEETEPTAESLSKAVSELKEVGDSDELAKRVDSIETGLKKLGEGGSSQNDEDPKEESISKSAIRKAFEDEGVDPALMELI